MNLPNPFSSSEAEASVFFISLLINDGRLQASLGKIYAGVVTIAEYSTIHSFSGDDECLQKVDDSLRDLGPDSENINEVVFGFEESWIQKDGVVSTRKPLLKKVTEKLGLEPIGFVPITEALTQFLMANDQMLSAVCVYAQPDFVYVYLIKQGKVEQSQKVGRSGSIVDDVTEGLGRLAQAAKEQKQYFPGKILLVSSALTASEVAERQQELLQHPWKEKYPFLQVPTVDLLPENTLMAAVTQQGGRAFAKVKGIPLKNPLEDTVQEEASGSTTASSFGVPISDGVLPPEKQTSQLHGDNLQSPDWDDEDTLPKKKKGKLSSFFATHKKQIGIGVLIGIITLAVMSFAFLSFATKAQVDIKLATVVVSKDVAITLDPNAESSDPEELILSAALVSKELSSSESIETTGVKLVGEEAKGTVTIFNKTESQKRFGAGTKLKTKDLVFILDEDVEVASASVEESHSGETKEYGQSEATVTAQEIGADGNVSESTNFSIDSFSENTYSASAKDAFSGGSSREIQVVAEADVKELTKEVTNSLEEEAEEYFKETSGNGKYLEPVSEAKQLEKTLSDEVGDEAEKVTLELSMEFSAIEYATDDLRPLATSVLGSEVPEGYTLLDEDPEILSSPSEEASEEGVVILDANISAKATPNIDLNALKQEILGKPVAEAQRILESKKEIQKALISLWPSLAESIGGKVPTNPDNVQMQIEE